MKKNIFLGIVFTAILASCSDDLGENKVQNPVQTGDEILFGSALSGNEANTRTVYGNRTETGIPVYWKEEGDMVAIFCPQASQPADKLVNYLVKPQTVDTDNDGVVNAEQSASVTKDEAEAAGLQWGTTNLHKFYAIYPATAVKGTAEEDESGKIRINMPPTQQVQSWRDERPAEGGSGTVYGLPDMDYAYMWAYNEVEKEQISEGKPISLTFHNLVTVLDITIPGPDDDGAVTVTNVNVEALNGSAILTGDFDFYVRADNNGHNQGYCQPVSGSSVTRNRISIPCYDKATNKFITLKRGERMNVKAYIIPNDESTIGKEELRITVATLNGAPCRRTLNQADGIVAHKINRVLLPPLVGNGTNYWLSNLDPNVYFSELSIPGSFQSAGNTADNGADAYQGVDIQQQFNDGIRFFSFQTTAPSNEGGELKLYYAGREQSTTLSTVANDIKSYVQAANDSPDNKNQNKNEFAVIEVWYKQTASTGIWGAIENEARKRWMKTVAQRVNDWEANNHFVVNPSADMTIGDLADKVVVIIRYADQVSDPIDPMSPYISEGFYNAVFLDWVDEKTEMQQIPVKFGNPGVSGSGLTINVTDVTYVNSSYGNGNISLDDKVALVKSLFDMSVTNYPNEALSLSNWYLNNLGGFYRTTEGGRGGDTRIYATDMNNKVVDILQDRMNNAAIGIVLMNFADKQTTSGARYKSDWLIQTIIDNNFKFELRTRPSGSNTTTYNATYSKGSNAIGWDE